MSQITETHLRYLLEVYDLSRTMPAVGATEIAKALAVSKPSVTRMLGNLMEKGLLVRERYGKVYLTDTGFLAARSSDAGSTFCKRRFPPWDWTLQKRRPWRRCFSLRRSCRSGRSRGSDPKHPFFICRLPESGSALNTRKSGSLHRLPLFRPAASPPSSAARSFSKARFSMRDT